MNTIFRVKQWGLAVLTATSLLCSLYSLSAQTIMGDVSGDPSALLDLKSTDRGVLMPRMTTAERSAIVNPAEGLLVFNTTLGCLEINAGSSGSPDWQCLMGATGRITALDCASATLSDDLTSGEEAEGVYFSLYYEGGDGAVHSGQQVISTGVAGLTATLSMGALSDGDGEFFYKISGTPSSGGVASFALNIGGQSCTVDLTVLGPGATNSLDCAGATTTDALIDGQAVNGLMALVPYTSYGGMYDGQTVTSTGITGLTATLSAGTFDNGSGSLSYEITGTPSGAGTASFALSIGGQSCTLALTVEDVGSLPAGIGSFAGQSCFDIALSNDNTNSCASLSERLARQADFTNAATHTQVYTFSPTGTVSNVRFAYINTNGDVVTGVSGGNSNNNISTAVTATVSYNTNLNSLALGLTNSNPLRSEIYVIYNDGANNDGTDRQLRLMIQVKDCVCCGAFVGSGVWRQFLCHNLGANEGANPFTPGWELNGNYYQWGRNPTCFGRDGVDDTNPCSSPVYGIAAPWGNTTANDNAGNIAGWNTTAAASTAWIDGSKTINDPCPVGWRVPTAAQLTVLANNTQNPRTLVGTWTAGTTNYGAGFRFGYALFIPAAGIRLGNGNGLLNGRSSNGYYWSSTISGSSAQLMTLSSSGATMANGNAVTGTSVRCIAE
jgi:uncharacterized protein (TIGR02145 family)